MNYDLSILIPARNEEFLSHTVKNIVKNARGNTEILVGLDGQWANPGVPSFPNVTIVYYPESVGQRAMTNHLCRLSRAKYIMKVDAHCAFDEGFDVKMMEEMQDDYTMVPLMKHLHVFDWKCNKCGNTWDQGRTPSHCMTRTGRDGKSAILNLDCDNTTDFSRVIFFEPRTSPVNISYRFGKDLIFQYWREVSERLECQVNKNLVESMSIQGSCFMLTRDKYWELDICDEGHGSWGQQGTEVACKTWLSGGKIVINRSTWYAHLFRTQGGDFGFPYPNPGVPQARQYSQDLWFSDFETLKKRWKPAIHDLNWLIKRFSPVPDWEEVKS